MVNAKCQTKVKFEIKKKKQNKNKKNKAKKQSPDQKPLINNLEPGTKN